jgi:GNAT superfamily N-acetyltransferase
MDVAIRVRPALPEEHAVLSDLARAAKAHWGYPEEWLELWRDDLTFTPERIARGGVVCAERAGGLLGCAAFDTSGSPAELDALWVHPAAIGTGIGRRLLAEVTSLARAGGATRLRIESDPNTEAFYLRMGARRVGETPSVPAGRRLPLLELELG